MKDFEQLPTTILGNLGEGFINEFATAKGAKPYTPSIKQSNPVDSLCIKDNKFFSIEVKTKVSMTHYPMTGMDTIDLKTYINFPCPVCVLFVDYLKGTMYYQWSNVLNKHKVEMFGHKHVIYFPLSIMKEYRKLTPEEIKTLSEHCNSSYK